MSAEVRRDQRLALAASLGGVVGAALAVAFSRTLGGGNYMAEGFASAMLLILGLGLLGYWLGAYAGAGAFWVADDRERDVAPGLLATGAMVGGWVAQSVAGLAFAFVIPLLPSGAGPLLAVLAGVPGAWLGALIATRVRWPKWRSRSARYFHVLLVLASLAGGAWAAVPRPQFPGAEAPAATRRAWAVVTFGEAYQQAEAFLKASPAVRERLGAVRGLAPVAGPNRTAYSPGELMGEFTIGVEGDRGRGVARLQFMDGGDGARFHGTLEHEGTHVPLGSP